MAWPTHQDYNEAVQNPLSAFSDTDLRHGQVELTNLGLPRPIAGNFACVYQIRTRNERWAARFFISEVSDQQRRYEIISTYLARVDLPYTVQFSYIPSGIKIQGKPYPLLKMQWVQGESLTAFVEKSLNYPETLLSIAKVWKIMMDALRAVNIAHGDLQHGNVLVVGDQLRLIDYDGMFVPGLDGKQSNEVGHRNYQLPSRTGWDFGPFIDNFSAWVIYVSLVALAVHPELWAKHRGGDECLIFRKEDFLHPSASSLLRDLSDSPNMQLRLLIELFTSLFNLSPQDVPSLDGLQTRITVGSTKGRIASSLSKNWWEDHVDSSHLSEEDQEDEAITSNIDSSAIDLGWIVDSLMEGDVIECQTFHKHPKDARVFIFGSLSIVILTGFLLQISVVEFSITILVALAINWMFCYGRFKNDQSQSEFNIYKQDVKNLEISAKTHQAVMDSISSERFSIQEKFEKNEREISAKKKRLDDQLQLEKAKINAELDDYLLNINQRRRETTESEIKKLDLVNGTLKIRIMEIDRKISGLNQKELQEKDAVLKTSRHVFVQTHLRTHLVKNCSIQGIAQTYKVKLFSAGFITAADISRRVMSIQGIGPNRGNALIHWRQTLESRANMLAPGLSSQEIQELENKYRFERRTLEEEKNKLQSALDNQIAKVRQDYISCRQLLNDEERKLHAANMENRKRVSRDYDAATAALNSEFDLLRSKVTPMLREMSEKFQNSQKKNFDLKWQFAKQKREGMRFASLNFKNYLYSVFLK